MGAAIPAEATHATAKTNIAGRHMLYQRISSGSLCNSQHWIITWEISRCNNRSRIGLSVVTITDVNTTCEFVSLDLWLMKPPYNENHEWWLNSIIPNCDNNLISLVYVVYYSFYLSSYYFYFINVFISLARSDVASTLQVCDI